MMVCTVVQVNPSLYAGTLLCHEYNKYKRVSIAQRLSISPYHRPYMAEEGKIASHSFIQPINNFDQWIMIYLFYMYDMLKTEVLSF